MLYGLTFVRWDERIGPEVLINYPEDFKLSVPTLMQLVSAHEYLDEPGMISIQNENRNIVSYFTGKEHPMYLNIAISLDDNPDDYEDILVDTTRELTSCISENSCSSVLMDLFDQIREFPILTEEQKLCLFQSDKYKNEILKRLRTEGSILKSELSIWFRDMYKSAFIDLENILSLFIKMNLAKRASISQNSDENLFFLHDIVVLRTPPVKILKEPEKSGLPHKFVHEYRQSTLKYFQDYRSNENDTTSLVNLILDPLNYIVLKAFRNSIQTQDSLKAVGKDKIFDIDRIVQKFVDMKLVVIHTDEIGQKYYVLQSDITVEKIFPEYLLNIIRKDFNYKVKPPSVLIEHLNLLEVAYHSIN